MVNVCDIQVMKPLLAEHGFHFSKAKGQNFLIAPWVPQSIADQAGVDDTARVLEREALADLYFFNQADNPERWEWALRASKALRRPAVLGALQKGAYRRC